MKNPALRAAQGLFGRWVFRWSENVCVVAVSDGRARLWPNFHILRFDTRSKVAGLAFTKNEEHVVAGRGDVPVGRCIDRDGRYRSLGSHRAAHAADSDQTRGSRTPVE